jgi:hypothetical protein
MGRAAHRTSVFKVLDSKSDRHIVQIFNQEETMIYANYRLKATSKTVLTVRETPPGQPDVLRACFYPGENFGDEFVYPKAKPLELAKVTNSPLPAAAFSLRLVRTRVQ